MSEWKEYRLGEVCIYNTERIPLNLLNEENYISTENMLPNIGGVTISSNLPTSGNAVHFYNGDILISNIRPYFKKIWYANKEGGCSADVLCIRANKDIDKQYLYYLLSQQDFFDYVMAGAKGCKMPRGDKQHIMNWEISLPSLPTQQKIANILSSLDDKIEVNRRINEQLEELAQALFKSWFVDFEPFKDGEFVESELGMIPKGWKVGELSEIGDIIGGATPSKSNEDYYTENGISWITS
jgi:type I restriction enzyme S subunit